jgi:polar amino acid transport system ATP-binding protein
MSRVEFVGVTKALGGNPVLNDISLTVPEGEVVCLLGPSGAGKSTLIKCVNGLVAPDTGNVIVDGTIVGRTFRNGVLRPMKAKEFEQQRRGIGMVFQQFNLFPHLTVSQNLLLSPRLWGEPRAELRERAASLLQKVGLSDKADAYPRHLSGGQQQRVAIARALMMKPKLMLFDEPTSALDPELVGEVLATMRLLASEGMTMIVVTHEIGFAREVATRVVFMADGTVVEQSDPDSFFSAPQTDRARAFLRHL